ncbi:MAG TPA: dTMP kinase [archaeon]|nr:dTMP kinase [archaeon]
MFLLCLEGPDFSGKSTLATAILLKLREKGLKVERTELPSRMVTGIMTDILRNSKDHIDPRVFALTYAADHLHHYLTFTKKNGSDVVIMERSLLSSLIYQGLVGKVDMDWLMEVNKHNLTRPDLTVIVKTPVEELLRRKQIRIGSEDEFEKKQFIKKVAEKYHNLPPELVNEFKVKYLEYAPMDRMVDEILSLIPL